MVHGLDRDTREFRSVAPLLVAGELIGPVTFIKNGKRTIGATDANLLRAHVGAQLTVATMLDGSANAAVGNWGLSRHAGLCLIELAQPLDPSADLKPLDLGAVGAGVDTRGAPAVLVGIARNGKSFERTWVPVQIDNDDGGGMADVITRLASPREDTHVGLTVDGASLFAWFPPTPALGRAGEVLVLGLARAYRGFAKPRDRPVLAEIVGLDDLGRALISSMPTEEREQEPGLSQVAGEIDR